MSFIGKKGPPGYVAGLGRGAVGFSTSVDIGTVAGVKLTADQVAAKRRELFAGEQQTATQASTYDKDDEEADKIYKSIDDAMENRRKGRREQKEKERLEKFRQERPKIQQQFSEYKRDLSSLTAQDWMDIPEPGDMRASSKKRRMKEKSLMTNASIGDAFLVHARTSVDHNRQMVDEEMDEDKNNEEEESKKDFSQMSKARDDLLRTQLDKFAQQKSGSFDSLNYLNELNGMIFKTTAEIGDIKKTRELMKSVVQTNPKYAAGWIAAARVEEADNKLPKAREIMEKARSSCPLDEDVWLESVRLAISPDVAKELLTSSLSLIPKSFRLWLHSINLELNLDSKKKVVRRALMSLPTSVELWNLAIELEMDDNNKKILLTKAVECGGNCSQNIDFWLKLAELETYELAQKVLNRARAANPDSMEIWIAAAKLEEKRGGKQHESISNSIISIITRASKKLISKGVEITKDLWIRQAVDCENSSSPLTCYYVIKEMLSFLENNNENIVSFLEGDEVKYLVANGKSLTLRSIYSCVLEKLPENIDLWKKAISFETGEELKSILAKARAACPQYEEFWILSLRNASSFPETEAIISQGLQTLKNSEKFVSLAVKMEIQHESFDKARDLLDMARKILPNSPRFWKILIKLETRLGNTEQAEKVLELAIKKFSTYDKLYLLKAKLDPLHAKETLSIGLKKCSKSPSLWIEASRLEDNIKSRALIDKAKIQIPRNEDLWLEAIRIEKQDLNLLQAKSLITKALQECPQSGQLWVEAIFIEPRTSRKSKSADALKHCQDNPHVVVAIARLFWMERNMEKARLWLKKGVDLNPSLGDSWIWWYKFELEYGNISQQQHVINQCKQVPPKHGYVWKSISSFYNQTIDTSFQRPSIEIILEKGAATLKNNLI